MAHTVFFWFDFASTYSYLSAMRIGPLAKASGVEVIWRPFLLGPIFRNQGWSTSPFGVYPNKGRYMWRDMERRAARFGIPFNRPDPEDPRAFPQHSVLAARAAQIAADEGQGAEFCRAVFQAEFAEGKDVSEAETLAEIARGLGLPDDTLTRAVTVQNKTLLRERTEFATQNGFFGAPTFMVGEEMFWGDDRLEDALAWAFSNDHA
ncbi:MAG: 2-hydroxychromene-2-carboxylate isomerase [Pseudomonadota bacterium]